MAMNVSITAVLASLFATAMSAIVFHDCWVSWEDIQARQ